MAASSTSSSPLLGTSDETLNGAKLMRLILDGGTEALRNVFRKIHPGNLQFVLFTNQHILFPLRSRPKIIDQHQWDKLYPAPPNQPNINDFDITLLSILLRNICSLSPPSSGWDNMPNVSDPSVQADIVRIKLFRNERFAHISNTTVSLADFKALWVEISLPLARLGIDQKEIDGLGNQLSVLDKHLAWCDFQEEIEQHYAKFTKDTRKWVFEQVSAWFNDETSKHRVFVISGLAGMGKSVIASVICKRYSEHLGASHFFYNHSQYNNPNVLLQSLAWHLCNVIPAYKEALIEKISGNIGESLNNNNTEALFSILFKEPFSRIPDPGKRILIVLDALDESEYNGRPELADLISNHLHKLPSYIRFVITTRPEKNLLDQFQKLNLLYIEPNDERNLSDLKLVIRETISSTSIPSSDLIDSLAEKSEGLMLYAFFLSEVYEEESCMHSIDSLPKGIEEYYERYFQRLENELVTFAISKDNFFSLLSALAVANQSLPEAFLAIIFGFEDSPRARQKVRKAINSLSSLLVIQGDKSISFFHKSIRDWLLDNSEHDYSVEVLSGHKILFDICVEKLNELKRTGVRNEYLASSAVKYALKYFIPHMLNVLSKTGRVEYFVRDYVADLEVLFASVSVSVDLTLNNITSLSNNDIFSNVSEDMKTTVDGLFFLIRKFSFMLRDYPQTFLQNVVNEGGEQLSLKASNLLKSRYKDVVYFELVEKEIRNNAVEIRCFLSGSISGIDISPNHDYVVCSYKEGGIELFSLATGKSEWKIDDFVVESPSRSFKEFTLPRCIVFHPHKSLIFPGRLGKALTLQGKYVTGPFQSDEGSSVFTNCCFSLDSSKMVTYFDKCLIFWDVFSGSKIAKLQCETLRSFSFSASGNYLGTTDIDNVFTIYNVANDYNVSLKKIESDHHVEIISTFDKNSWLCCFKESTQLKVMNHNLSSSSAYSVRFLGELILPNDTYTSGELQRFLEDPKKSWFSKVKKKEIFRRAYSWHTVLRYILIDDKSVLIFSCLSDSMRVIRIQSLFDTEEPTGLCSVVSHISANGDIVYLNNEVAQTLTVCKLDSKRKFSKRYSQLVQTGFLRYLPFARKRGAASDDYPDILVVRDGVIIFMKNDIPVLWNYELTRRLSNLYQLAGAMKCLSVSDEIIACVYKGHIIYFNVSSKQILHKIVFTESVKGVVACSIKHNMLMEKPELSLCKDAVIVNGWADVFDKYCLGSSLFLAEFSPEGNRLALSCGKPDILVVFDVFSLSCLVQFPVCSLNLAIPNAIFFDDETLLYNSSENIIYLVNVERDNILTCLDVGDIPDPISVCRKRNIVCVGHLNGEKFNLIKVFLHRQPKIDPN